MGRTEAVIAAYGVESTLQPRIRHELAYLGISLIATSPFELNSNKQATRPRDNNNHRSSCSIRARSLILCGE